MQFANTLENVFHIGDAPTNPLSDCAKIEIISNILCDLIIEDWLSAPNYQHQHAAECFLETIKCNVYTIIEGTTQYACVPLHQTMQ